MYVYMPAHVGMHGESTRFFFTRSIYLKIQYYFLMFFISSLCKGGFLRCLMVGWSVGHIYFYFVLFLRELSMDVLELIAVCWLVCQQDYTKKY